MRTKRVLRPRYQPRKEKQRKKKNWWCRSSATHKHLYLNRFSYYARTHFCLMSHTFDSMGQLSFVRAMNFTNSDANARWTVSHVRFIFHLCVCMCAITKDEFTKMQSRNDIVLGLCTLLHIMNAKYKVMPFYKKMKKEWNIEIQKLIITSTSFVADCHITIWKKIEKANEKKNMGKWVRIFFNKKKTFLRKKWLWSTNGN